MHGIEATDTRCTDGSLGTTSNNGIGLAQTNQVKRVSQCVR